VDQRAYSFSHNSSIFLYDSKKANIEKLAKKGLIIGNQPYQSIPDIVL
jgi:16S rRNA A1518/A1519 N6-dimethyltransferase RsmA/KsgA/DIM1 with predicted DNA glycosylase/AP lyase activity